MQEWVASASLGPLAAPLKGPAIPALAFGWRGGVSFGRAFDRPAMACSDRCWGVEAASQMQTILKLCEEDSDV